MPCLPSFLILITIKIIGAMRICNFGGNHRPASKVAELRSAWPDSPVIRALIKGFGCSG